jgi:signal transduction histidine kinase/ligand-binding sensor domain-containing protein
MIRRRGRIVTATGLVILVALGIPSAFALNPQLDVVQYAHTSWRISDGFSKGAINAIAQTPDGYLWLGTTDGLLRFDGVKAIPLQPIDQSLPSKLILDLFTARDGVLWIATDKGIASLRGGRVTRYAGPDNEYRAGTLIESRDGAIWAAVYRPGINNFVLCRFQQGGSECHGEDGGPGRGAVGLYADSHGQLWVGVLNGVWRWQPGPPRFFSSEGEPNGFQGFAEDSDGTLLISRRGGVDRFVEGRFERKHRFPASLGQLQYLRMLSDRNGNLWLRSSSAGLLHIHQGVVDVFGAVDGLTSDVVRACFEDREGSIWVATSEGLDRFRDVAIATVTTRQGLSSSRANGFAAGADGSVWIATWDGLARVLRDHVVVYRERGQPSGQATASRDSRTIRYVAGKGLPSAGVQSVFEDHLKRLWMSTDAGVGYLENDHLVPVNGIPGGLTRSITEDATGAIWIANQADGLFRVPSGGAPLTATAWTAVGVAGPVTVALGDARTGGVWLGSRLGGIAYFTDGRLRRSFGLADGLAPGRVSTLYFDSDATLWISTDGGLSRLKDNKVATLTAANGLPCDAAQWAIRDNAGALWVLMPCGLVRIAAPDLEGWAKAADRGNASSHTLPVTVFGNSDGFRSSPGVNYYSAPVVKSSDGRLWFQGTAGIHVQDPGRLPFNALPPSVLVEQVTADHKTYDANSVDRDGLRLPPLTRDLQIDYTALSFVAPEKMRFRYQLEGYDRSWQDVGTRRQAFYTDLRPGQYRFRVAAANNSGVWNETGATLGFSIAPAYYQTTWFMTLAGGLVLALAWGAHRIRLRMVERHEREISALNERMMKAQEQERIRIAGELHDGVMQQMLAATMTLGSAKRRITGNPDAAATIDKVQDLLVQAGTEIRQLSHDLHPPILQEAGLPQAVLAYCEQFSAAAGIPIACEADDTVSGLSRGASLALFRIVQEALGNTAKHAKAKQVTVRLRRINGVVSLVISDDGVGFDTGWLGSHASGGLGLVMMRERATQLNGTFELDTAARRGTTIIVSIPFR